MQTIEATDKTWKAIQLVGLLIVIVGGGIGLATLYAGAQIAKAPGLPAVLAASDKPTLIVSGFVFAVGLVVCLAGSLAAWWYHG